MGHVGKAALCLPMETLKLEQSTGLPCDNNAIISDLHHLNCHYDYIRRNAADILQLL